MPLCRRTLVYSDVVADDAAAVTQIERCLRTDAPPFAILCPLEPALSPSPNSPHNPARALIMGWWLVLVRRPGYYRRPTATENSWAIRRLSLTSFVDSVPDCVGWCLWAHHRVSTGLLMPTITDPARNALQRTAGPDLPGSPSSECSVVQPTYFGTESAWP